MLGLLALVTVQTAPAVILPAGTTVPLLTKGAIHSQSVIQGQRFALEVANDVTIGARVVIPRGTPAVGEVEAVSGNGMFGKAARLTLRPLFVEMGDQRVNLVGSSEEKGADGTAGAAVTTVLVGAFGLIITGKSAVVPAGSAMLAKVRSDAAISQR